MLFGVSRAMGVLSQVTFLNSPSKVWILLYCVNDVYWFTAVGLMLHEFHPFPTHRNTEVISSSKNKCCTLTTYARSGFLGQHRVFELPFMVVWSFLTPLSTWMFHQGCVCVFVWQLIWDRALGLPIERPKSMTFEYIVNYCKSKSMTA